jgi:hypothetical protein
MAYAITVFPKWNWVKWTVKPRDRTAVGTGKPLNINYIEAKTPSKRALRGAGAG